MSGPDADPAPLRPGVVWAVASLALLMNTLDASIVNVALPTIRRDLGANISELQWVVDAYTLALAALLLSAGTAGDRFGHRRAAAAGMAVFVAASAACGAAPGAGLLVAARAAQGVGAALLMASTLSLLTVAFPDQRRRARAIGWWAVFSGVGFSAGPP
ncbi:MAG: MFS transporter, partial [Actinomycetota bacterium]|nr:MFS transporter [Actinomycetota bacterium]